MASPNHYLQNQRLVDALVQAQRDGAPTAEACECFRLIARHLLGDSRYSRYPADVKEDMISEALLKGIKSIKSFKIQYADSAFSWATKIIEQSFWRYLQRHYYRPINIQRDLQQRMMITAEAVNPAGAETLRRSALDPICPPPLPEK